MDPYLLGLRLGGRRVLVVGGGAVATRRVPALVNACTDDPAVNAAVAAAADQQHIWCVRADDAQASAAWTPASGQADDVRIGVLSGDPRRSAAIRDAILARVIPG